MISKPRAIFWSTLEGSCRIPSRARREEVLDFYIFESLSEVQALTDHRLLACNEHRPHDARGATAHAAFSRGRQPRRSLAPRGAFDGEAYC
jgi:hypothetical protein